MKRRRTGRSDSDGGSPSTEDATTTPHPQQPIGSQKWSNEEDARLVELVKEYGTLGKWHLIGQHLGGRNARQCRERWSYKLDPAVNKTPFSDDEVLLFDQLLQKYGLAWSIIAKHMPGRCANDLRNRYNSAKRSHDHKKKAMKRSSPSSSDKSGINKGEAEVNKDVGGKHSPEKTGIQGGAHQPLAADVSGPLCAAPASDSSVIDVIASQDTDDVPATMPRMEPIVVSKVGEDMMPPLLPAHHKRKPAHVIPLSQLAGHKPAVLLPASATYSAKKLRTSEVDAPVSAPATAAPTPVSTIQASLPTTLDVSRPVVSSSVIPSSVTPLHAVPNPTLSRGLDQFHLTLPTLPPPPLKQQHHQARSYPPLPSPWLGHGLSPLDQSVAVTGNGWDVVGSLSPGRQSISNLAPFSSGVTPHASNGYPIPPTRAPVLPFNDYTGEYGRRISPAHYSALALPDPAVYDAPFPRMPSAHSSPPYYIDHFGNHVYPSLVHPQQHPMYHEPVSPFFGSPSILFSSASPWQPQPTGSPVDHGMIALGSNTACGVPQLFRPATSTV